MLMNECKFKRYFKEPKEKYVCMSISLFVVDEYIKHNKNDRPYNVLDEKINIFIKNMTLKAKQLLTGYFPKNYYMRIYFDESIKKNKYLNKLLKTFKTYDKIQLIKFECPKFKTNNKNHLHLFGTIMRFHALFDKESPNIEMCLFLDADSIYKPKYLEEVNKFYKSNKLVLAFNSFYQLAFYMMDSPKDINDYSILDYVHLPAGLTTIKKKKEIFLESYWNKYLNNLFDQQDLLLVFNYLDFKRFSCPKNDSNYQKQSYYSFEYGFDEIWLKFVIKKILSDTNNSENIEVLLTSPYNNKLVLKRIIVFFEYAKNRNKYQFELFIDNCNFLHKKTFEEFKKYILKIKNDNNLKYLFEKIVKNKYFKKLYFQDSLKYLMINFNKLISLKKKYFMKDIFYN